MLIVRGGPPLGWALVSICLQWLALSAFWVTVDLRLRRLSTRFAWAALGSLYPAFTVLDAFLVRMTSLPLREILPMLLASRNVVEGMREIGLKPSRLLVLALCLSGAGVFGGLVRNRLARSRPPLRHSRRTAMVWAFAALTLVGCFVIEQTASRDDRDYLFRGFHIPAYEQLYSMSHNSVALPLPPPVEHSARMLWLSKVGHARNPKHVLYVLLESFRADAVTSTICPAMSAIAADGVSFDSALAEATYTPLSWSVLMFDEAAYDNLFGRHPGRPEPLGGWLFATMQQAGYTTHAFFSTNVTYAKMRDRLLGRGHSPIDFFQAAADAGDDPEDKNRNDRVVVDHTVRFIREHRWDEGHEFILLQLDSTHYTYPFPEDRALFTPYSENLVIPRPIETAAEATLLQNRYKNAAHFVDAELGRVIAAFKERGLYDDLAIVITGDHGEGLSPGLQGHAAVFDATRRVPLVFKLPGTAPGRHETRLVSHRDILPTLAHYLDIPMPPGTMRGEGIEAPAPPGVLTISPSGRYGQLTTPGAVFDLRLVFTPHSVVVTPVSDGADKAKSQWVRALSTALSRPDAS
jgi:arylsulfatase A-like enzyme